ncbi:MAG: hypothetical protein JWM20_252 [Patescibacteria group bacterium]|nr:hypothetical protein [Patescibacteria group bacterium]
MTNQDYYQEERGSTEVDPEIAEFFSDLEISSLDGVKAFREGEAGRMLKALSQARRLPGLNDYDLRRDPKTSYKSYFGKWGES